MILIRTAASRAGHRRCPARPKPRNSAIFRMTSPVRFPTDICPMAVRFSGHLTGFRPCPIFRSPVRFPAADGRPAPRPTPRPEPRSPRGKNASPAWQICVVRCVAPPHICVARRMPPEHLRPAEQFRRGLFADRPRAPLIARAHAPSCRQQRQALVNFNALARGDVRSWESVRPPT
jgi:hypothetical protein